MKFPTKGSLSDTSLIEILKDAAQSGLTGMIRLENAPVIKVIYFNQGTISFASSNDKADRLTEVLKRSGKLTPEQVQDAQTRLKPNVSLGKTLLELGYVSAKDLLWGAHAQVDGIIHHLLFWNQGKYQVFEGTLPQEMVHLNLPVASMIFQGITKTQNREWILQHIGSPDAVYVLASDFQEQNQKLNLPVSDFVLRLNGQSSLHEIAESSDLDTFEICKTVVALEYLDLVRPFKREPLPIPVAVQEIQAPAEAVTDSPEPNPLAEEEMEKTQVLPPRAIEEVPATSGDKAESSQTAEISEPQEATLVTAAPVQEAEKIREPEQPVEDSAELEAAYQQVLAAPELDQEVPMQSMTRDSQGPAFRWKWVAIILLVVLAAASGVFYYVLKEDQRARSLKRAAVRQDQATQLTLPAHENPVLREIPPEGPIRLLRNGRVADSAKSWNEALTKEPHGYSIQLVIACQAKTVADTHQLLNYSNQIIVLPVNHKGQVCHRVMFGKYSSKGEAEAAIEVLPHFFTQQNSPASIVEISEVIF
jgi:Domain of unknown function (DUF4388)